MQCEFKLSIQWIARVLWKMKQTLNFPEKSVDSGSWKNQSFHVFCRFWEIFLIFLVIQRTWDYSEKWTVYYYISYSSCTAWKKSIYFFLAVKFSVKTTVILAWEGVCTQFLGHICCLPTLRTVLFVFSRQELYT